MPFFTSPISYNHANFMETSLASLNMQAVHGMSMQPAMNQAQLSLATATSPPPHSSHPALPRLTLLVFEAVLEVVCVSLPGYIIARQGMFPAEMQKFAAELNVAVFTPCLSTPKRSAAESSLIILIVFTKLASQLTTDKLADLAIIPLIFVVQTLISYLCSIAVSKAFGFSKRPRNFVIAMGVSHQPLCPYESH